MDVYSVTFTYPRPQINTVPGLFLTDNPNDGPSVEAVHALCVAAMATFPVSINYWQNSGLDDPSLVGGAGGLQQGNAGAAASKSFNFLISGAYASVLAARGYILRECPVVTRTSIPVPRSEILDAPSPLAQPSLKPTVRRRLDDVASQTLAHIAVVNPATSNNSLLPPPLTPLRRASSQTFSSNGHNGHSAAPFPASAFPIGNATLETEPMCHIVITGSSTAPSVAKVRLLVMLDEMAGLHAESIEIDNKLHPIIAGRRRNVIQSIQEETSTNIYLPEQLRLLVGGNAGGPSTPPTRPDENIIWITGEYFGVQRARDMLYKNAHAKTQTVISRDCAILPRKLDWMLTERLDELKAIMSDHATYLEFPPLGSQTSLVSVYGDERANIHRAIRAVMLLATQHLSAQFYLLPTHFNLLMPSSSINPTQIPPLLKHLGAITNGRSEVVFRDNCFEFYGSEVDVRRGVAAVGDVGIVKTFHHEIRFQLELANEHREFISGKKNGKINKIMQLTGCRIRFESLAGVPTPPMPQGSGFANGGRPFGVPPSPSHNSAPGVSPQQPSPLIAVQHATPNPNSPTTPTNPTPMMGYPPPPGIPTTGHHLPMPAPPGSSLTPILNFLITLSGTSVPETLQGLMMLLEELPAEISFHVPETYHKRIIGVGGRTIQRIMKKYGVFVKFFNGSAAEGDFGGNANGQSPEVDVDREGNTGSPPTPVGNGDAEDNVVARTPAKNAANLENLKVAVLELVNPQDKDFTYETVAIPRRYHRILLGEKSIFIKDIETKTGSKVRFPDKETASDVVSIYGPESQVHIAAARLLDHVPFEADMTIANYPELAGIVASPEYATFSERIKRDYQVVIVPRVPALSAGGRRNSSVSSTSTDAGADSSFASFKFRCQRSNSDLLTTAREALEGFLAMKSSATTTASASAAFGHLNGSSPLASSDFKPHRRADSFADSFQHFNSKLLSTANDSHSRLLSRRIRMATSSPDVKALFNSHSHSHSPSHASVYKLPEHDEQDDAGFQAPSQEGNEYYHPPARIRHAPSASFLPGFRETEESFKRGSDSRLQEKLRDQNKGQRSLTNRAQSLDLTSLNRPERISVVQRIPSPVDSTNPSSPTSASATTPSFPTVNGPSASHYTHQNHYSFPNASYTQPSHHHQHHLSYSRPRTQVSLSSSSSSLSLSSAIEQPAVDDASVIDDVSRVIGSIRLDGLQ